MAIHLCSSTTTKEPPGSYRYQRRQLGSPCPRVSGLGPETWDSPRATSSQFGGFQPGRSPLTTGVMQGTPPGGAHSLLNTDPFNDNAQHTVPVSVSRGLLISSSPLLHREVHPGASEAHTNGLCSTINPAYRMKLKTCDVHDRCTPTAHPSSLSSINPSFRPATVAGGRGVERFKPTFPVRLEQVTSVPQAHKAAQV